MLEELKGLEPIHNSCLIFTIWSIKKIDPTIYSKWGRQLFKNSPYDAG